ncbi:MAG: [protein-PII] uridylyltransferase [Sphingomonadaceae bacterium]|uniref:[protein-PII] uridylyltransferase n=1 Tax=Thermaurantiacus sp. TaxID=2820283 RepID=UPI00298EEDB9|nr:[protein-PII] uridylyltransferase [Thermaurantiacus sp.]MCS6986316.1 [protein-PII] uridylyltransferase [Sphingomonadaceae bacterium]MDW8414422.1 [protein-PII] uridylyltransferase [Thermaurantiacus sp.]
MRALFDAVPNRREIIDRRFVMAEAEAAVRAAPLEERRAALVRVLRRALAQGRAVLARRLEAQPTRGLEYARAQCFLVDQVLRVAFDVTVAELWPNDNPTLAERLALVAVGGHGRGELAPFSDVDLMVLAPMRATAWVEQVAESLFYTLWDVGLKVGHSVRTVDEAIRMARADLSVRTALLESRYLWGDGALADELAARFRREVVEGRARAFVAEKMAEREARHRRLGDSRYLVEPHIKEGKGGLRDLQTLFWIGKFVLDARDPAELVAKGLFTPAEYRQFQHALNHLWAIRCHLHTVAGRGEERLTFDRQREIAERMGYRPRRGQAAVERFMRHYFMTARRVGDLTSLFLAHLDDVTRLQGRLTRWLLRPRRLRGFLIERGRIDVPTDDFFREDPVRLLELFHLADAEGLDIHPQAMRQAARDATLIGEKVRREPRANALFLDILTSPRDPEKVLRWMNEAGVFGRFVPDFGRVVAKMQYDMYHHYTVDEHTIRAIGLLARLEKGEFAQEHPLSTALMRKIASRRALYVAVLLHDIAKGRGGDHSVLGEEVALRLGPRLGLEPAETETVAWLVRHHLLMSATAFKRDLADPKTVLDFCAQVKSLERLRLLLVLTVVDIRAVGPGVWNGWKAQLLTTLFEAAEEVLRLGHRQKGREARIAERKARLEAAVRDVPADVLARHRERFYDSYWLAEPEEVLVRNLRQMAEADASGEALSIRFAPDPDRGTLVSVYTADHPGLFYRIAGGISLAGANIAGARIHTTRDGMAIDNLLVQDPLGGPFAEPEQLERLRRGITDAITGRVRLAERLANRPLPRRRQEAFRIQPQVFIDNEASTRLTVVEVNALDRPALLFALTYALFGLKIAIHSAHVATYGERAVDTFYLTDLLGAKITSPARLEALRRRLLEVAAAPGQRRAAPEPVAAK